MTIHVCGVPGRLPHGHTLRARPAEIMSLYYSVHFRGKIKGAFTNFPQKISQAVSNHVLYFLLQT